jgi:hypothetical protein
MAYAPAADAGCVAGHPVATAGTVVEGQVVASTPAVSGTVVSVSYGAPVITYSAPVSVGSTVTYSAPISYSGTISTGVVNSAPVSGYVYYGR